MKILLYPAPVVLMLLFVNTISAQNQPPAVENNAKAKNKSFGIASIVMDTAVQAQPEEELKELRIDTGRVWQPEDEVNDTLPAYPDTTAVPEDELTFEIRKLFVEVRSVETAIETLKRQLESMKHEEHDLPDEFFDRLLSEFSSESTTRILENMMIRTYRKFFTIDDVKELSKFYRSDIGKKSVKFFPAIFEESTKAGAQIGFVIGEKVARELEKEGKLN